MKILKLRTKKCLNGTICKNDNNSLIIKCVIKCKLDSEFGPDRSE